MDLGRYLILSHAQKEDTAGSTSPGFHILPQVSGAQMPLSEAQPRRLGRPSTSPGARCCRAMAFMAGCCSSSWEFKHGWWLDSDRQNLWAPAKLGFDILALLCDFNWFYGNRFDPTRMEITNKQWRNDPWPCLLGMLQRSIGGVEIVIGIRFDPGDGLLQEVAQAHLRRFQLRLVRRWKLPSGNLT